MMNKRMFSLSRKILTTLALFVLPFSVANAQSGAISPTIGVSPTKILETVKPGVAQEFSVGLRNYGKDPLPLSGSITGISTIQESGVPVFTDKISPHSADQWLEVVDKDVILAPGEQQQIKVKASPPKTLAPGSYHAAAIFQAKLPSYYFDLDSDTRILPAISVLFFLTVETDRLPTVEDLKIEQIQVPKIVVSTPLSISANIKNPSNFYVQADAKAEVKTTFGKSAGSDDLGRVIILPDGTRKFVSAYTKSLIPGVYTASVQLLQGDKVLVASSKFLAIPWQFIVLLIGGTIFLLFTAFRRRFRHAFRVLIGKDHIARHQPKRPTLR